jgi:hypothetical protein
VTALRITGFSGMLPRRGARLLEENQAQVAMNCRLTSGYIAPLNDTKRIYAPGVPDIRSIFKINNGVDDFWLAWDVDVDAVKGPIAGDATFRTYFTGDNEPRVTDLSLATSSTPYPKQFYVLGVYPPKTAPGASHAGGAGAAISRAFAYTFVTQWGEESQPSPASAVTAGKVDGTWTVNNMDVAPANTFAVLGATWSGGIATLQVGSTFGLRIGEEFSLAGMTPSGYNTSSSVITALDATHISYAVASNPGAFAAGGTVTKTAPHNTTGMTKRIYWTETTVQGTAFQFVKEIAVATTSDTVAGNTVAGEVLPSEDWPMPPVSLRGLCLHPSGAMVGVSMNEVCFSEPNKPYAWPEAYKLAIDYDGVGCGVFGQSVLIATEGMPYVATGVEPASMTLERVDQPWPCLSKRSIVSFGYAVAYAAPQGLVMVGLSGAQIVTKDLYTQEEWLLLNPDTFAAGQYAGRYVAAYDGDGKRQMIVIDKSEFASVVGANKDVATVWGDPSTGNLFVVINDVIEQWDADTGMKMVSDWLSREFVFPSLINLGAARVDIDLAMSEEEIAAAQAAYDAIKAANEAIIAALASKGSLNAHSLNTVSLNGSLIQTLPPITWESLTFQLYVDGAIKYSKTITNRNPFRLPSGYTTDNAAVRVSGNVIVKAIQLAESMRELSLA